jgi:hypothetical protein
MATSTFTVSANADWQNKLSISAGQGFTVKAQGQWYWDPGQSPVGAGGTGQNNPDMPIPTAHQGCLIVQIHPKNYQPPRPPFPVGPQFPFPDPIPPGPQPGWVAFSSDNETLGVAGDQIKADSELWFRINDDNIDDNQGVLAITVTI